MPACSFERESEVLSLDARPSDSIAVALRAKVPIYVNEDLLQDPPREPDETGGEPPAASRATRSAPSSCGATSSG